MSSFLRDIKSHPKDQVFAIVNNLSCWKKDLKAWIELFHGHLAVLGEEIENIKVWDNPIVTFEEDGGRHPNPEQTAEILLFLDAKAKEDMGVSIFLGSGPNDLISQKKKYRGVKSLCKYGCGACTDKSRH